MWAPTVPPPTPASSSPCSSRVFRPRSRAASPELLLAFLLGLLSGCDSSEGNRTLAIFDLAALDPARSATTDLYAIPFPNDLRRRSDGTVDLGPLATGQPELIQRYLDLTARAESGGFSTNGAAYFRFSGPIDPACLPTPEGSRQPGSSVQWINIDERSVGYGSRIPVRVRFSAESGRYMGEHSLAVLPMPGFTLEPETRYAVLIGDTLCDVKGDSVGPAADFVEMLSESSPTGRPEAELAYASLAPLRAYLKQFSVTGLVSAAAFTTGAPARLAGRARAVLMKSAAPTAEEVEAARETSAYVELRGSYTAPNFQTGAPPYMQPADGGAIELDANKDPKPQRNEKLRFALTVPKGEMPADGWPIVIYAHGTGGDYRSFIDGGHATTLAAIRSADGALVGQLAMVGIDQNLHGPRAPAGTSPDLAFFNLQNPAAAVANVLQAGIDDFSLLRMLKGLELGGVAWAAGSGRAGKVAFSPPFRIDPKRVYFMGHSQGSETGPMFLAHEPEVRAAVLSGAGGGAALSLLDKTEPIAIRALLEAALKEPIDELHPVLNLFQMMLEPADPLNYASMFIKSPPAGSSPKHIFVSQGLVDHYTPNSTTDALATAIGLPIVGPVLRPIEGLELRGLEPRVAPLAGNLSVAGQAVTGGLLQYHAFPMGNKTCTSKADCSGGYCDAGHCYEDGHFVIYDDPTAKRQYSLFLGTTARDGVPSILP